ncbi:MAG TPA: CDP-diacylglycerol--serine O-phosphatidyltransferase [Candidatus Hydrogenedentes bacterium]|jgi:CDP-diacylglycerol--serine O-phosphatidyltransferase|nr:CDP-diacylglycerol--serine O-phosphatidyltransferase [Candidatus Hydrogenedentota bacterium]HOC70659.1 CDP-diacylglycerol--serine O-phosphatidyltransferase [Candidatus Hydrogenedentota bacterium]
MKILPKIKRTGKSRRVHINVLASVMTTMNLYMGTSSILASIGLEYQWAATCILLAIVFDMLDGYVARLTHSESDFGKELDSLCDMVSFGVAPAVLVFVAYLPADAHLPLSPRTESILGMSGSYMAIVYVICAALRLARFNVYHAGRHDSFIGLPSPGAAGALASFMLFLIYFEAPLDRHALGAWAYVALGPTAVFLALLMVSPVRYPKNRFKSFLFRPRNAFLTLAICAFAMVIVHYAIVKSVSLVLFPLAVLYVFFGIGDTLYGKIVRREAFYEASMPDEPEEDEESDDREETETGFPPENEGTGTDSV